MSDYKDIQAINHSSLSWFEVSPQYYHKMVTKELKQEEADHFDLGSALHASILEPTVFNDRFVLFDGKCPTHPHHVKFCSKMIGGDSIINAYKATYSVDKMKDDKIESESQALYKEYSDYINTKSANPNKVMLEKELSDKISRATISIAKHKLASQLLCSDMLLIANDPEIQIFTELAIEFEWPNTTIKCKSKLDKLIVSHKKKEIILCDLKHTGKPIKKFRSACRQYNYIRQLMFYSVGVSQFLKQMGIDTTEYTVKFYIVAVETELLHETRAFRIREEDVYHELPACDNLVKTIAEHYKRGEWDYPIEYYDGDGETLLILNFEEKE